MQKVINGVEVTAPEFISDAEIEYGMEYAKSHIPKTHDLREVELSINEEGNLAIDWKAIAHFERIRRITGLTLAA